jgi:hypothetical protein
VDEVQIRSVAFDREGGALASAATTGLSGSGTTVGTGG